MLYSRMPTLDLHGYDRDYGRILINQFIDDQLKQKNKELIIVHGIGTGILKKMTQETLKKNKYVKEYKIDNDPRITKIGNFLRKTSLDELPNIWAIFTGKISVIGPRPLMREEVDEKYKDNAEKLLSVKPGMIGWWAANGRSNTTYESGKRQELELYYVDNCSLWLDIKIIFKTLIRVFKRDGAK